MNGLQNARQAALDSYDTEDPKSADVIANKNLNNPSVQEAIRHELKEAGVTERDIALLIKEGLNATRVGYNQKEGEFIESDIPDHTAREKYIKAWERLTGAAAPTKVEHTHKFGVIGEEKRKQIRARLIPAKG